MSPTTGPRIPFPEGTEEYGYYENLQNVVRSRFPDMKPRILVITDIEQDYDDLLAIIFLSEMHRMGAIELAGCVANHHPADKRAKFLRTTLDCLNLADVPVAIGTKGASDISAHAPDLYYGLKNKTFAEHAEQRSTPVYNGEELINFLVDQSGKVTKPGELPKQKLTVLLISSLQDISEAFDRWKSVPDAPFPKDKFEKFVSQGGYKLENGQLWPEMGMMNNKFHRQAAKNYTRTLSSPAINLRSDAWSREAAKRARLEGSFFQKLFQLGPIGAHLEWMWLRQEFKFYYDPINDPYMPHLDVGWYLSTRLGLKKDSELFQQYVKSIPPFKEIIPLIKVIAYDCCAAVGAVGDDFMRSFGILQDPIPEYNKSVHRVFGRAADDMGGINTEQLAKVMEVFLLGGLLATKDHAEELLKTKNDKTGLFEVEIEHTPMTYANTVADWTNDKDQPLIVEAKKCWKELQGLKDKQADAQDNLELARVMQRSAEPRDKVTLAEKALNEVVTKQTKAEIALNFAIERIQEDSARDNGPRKLKGKYNAKTPELFGAPYELLYRKDVLAIERIGSRTAVLELGMAYSSISINIRSWST
ncbi:hypothetical protein B0T21DRAFT_401348 [Apiosordaria backusii]|uniref:Inosine/uridine-preferring nucleoside hydrolase domain-containing protein n=1 Tax=Apiosordaria backusii TaxID=314023 RepID=A0AA40BN88_9PEZI|nr:hypothetical protein B0T21DRAFT_401348 [Apiosordaria backusii]